MILILIIEGFELSNLREQNFSFVNLTKPWKSWLESVVEDNGRLDIDTVLNFWPYTPFCVEATISFVEFLWLFAIAAVTPYEAR